MKSYLTSGEMLAEIGFHIGFKDLILSPQYPPYQSDFAKSFQVRLIVLQTVALLLFNQVRDGKPNPKSDSINQKFESAILSSDFAVSC